jgi:hypothetical protein
VTNFRHHDNAEMPYVVAADGHRPAVSSFGRRPHPTDGSCPLQEVCVSVGAYAPPSVLLIGAQRLEHVNKRHHRPGMMGIYRDALVPGHRCLAARFQAKARCPIDSYCRVGPPSGRITRHSVASSGSLRTRKPRSRHMESMRVFSCNTSPRSS